ncbi:MAG: hypothetical protein WCF78_01535 [archaeon]
MPLPKPILKARFMQKRLAHEIKRTGAKAKTGKTKGIWSYIGASREHQIVEVEKHQLKDARYEKVNNALIKEKQRVRDSAKGKGLIAQREAKEKIIELERQFIEKYVNKSRIDNNRKIRQANIIIEKLAKVTSEGDVQLFKREIQRHGILAADAIIKNYVDFMKVNNLNYTELTRHDATTLMYLLTSKLPRTK